MRMRDENTLTRPIRHCPRYRKEAASAGICSHVVWPWRTGGASTDQSENGQAGECDATSNPVGTELTATTNDAAQKAQKSTVSKKQSFSQSLKNEKEIEAEMNSRTKIQKRDVTRPILAYSSLAVNDLCMSRCRICVRDSDVVASRANKAGQVPGPTTSPPALADSSDSMSGVSRTQAGPGEDRGSWVAMVTDIDSESKQLHCLVSSPLPPSR